MKFNRSIVIIACFTFASLILLEKLSFIFMRTNNEKQGVVFEKSLVTHLPTSQSLQQHQENSVWGDSLQHEAKEERTESIESTSSHNVANTDKPKLANSVIVIPQEALQQSIQAQDPIRQPPSQQQQVAPSRTATAATASKPSFTTTTTNINSPLGIACNSSIMERYNQVQRASLVGGKDPLQWCRETRDNYHVIVGKSWGGLNKGMQKQWDSNNCNELLNVGELLPCSRRWGWRAFEDWTNKQHTIVTGYSTVDCRENVKASLLCRYDNVTMDFSRISIVGSSREFHQGFLTTYGHLHSGPYASVNINAVGKSHVNLPNKKRREEVESFAKVTTCDVYEDRPVFVLSNDDIFNIGHYINDVATIWNMLVMWNISGKDAVLLNFDGLRDSGPAGGHHRLMLGHSPDEHGPYVGYYQSWFQQLVKASDYGKQKVCFRSLYFMPNPGMPWFWNDWGRVSDCSVIASSPLYQSFETYLMSKWQDAYGKLPDPPSDKVHIVIEVRAINPAKRDGNSVARHIANLPDLVAALNSISNVIVTAQDFAKLKFPEQVALAHRTGVMLSMHGAGTTHIFHMSLGKPNCCALIELQPDHSRGFQDAWGYANLARMLGLHYWRAEGNPGTTTNRGTIVDVQRIKQMAIEAVERVRVEPTCLHDVRYQN